MPTITLSRPLQGQAVTVLATDKNAKLALEFSTDDVSLSRDADSLIFTFEDGAAIRIDDFYTSYHAANIPEFEVDGKLVSGTEFFSALGPDLIPAAGPATVARTARSSDHGAVSDLASGVDSLDGTDITIEGSAFQTGSLLFDSSAASLTGAAGSGATGPGDAAELPFFPAGPFVRAVLYSPGATGDAVTTNVFFGANGAAPAAIATGVDFDGTNAAAPYAVSVSLPAGWSSSWVDVSFNSLSGRLEFRLTADGVAEMQRLGLTGESLVDFIHITVTDRASGDSFEYNVELVATDNQDFDSAAHDSLYGGQHLDNIGEFHQGQNNGGAYSVVSSSQNDEIIINDTVIGGSSIHASGSADPAQMADDYNTINLNAGVENTTPGSTTHITSADGKLTVLDGVLASGSGAENVIHMGKGEIHISNAADAGVYADNGASNSITTENGSVTVSATGNGDSGMHAASSGSNSINTGNGTASVSGGIYGMDARSSGSNTINTENGDARVSGGYIGMSALSSGSKNTITTEGGDVYVKGIFGMDARSSGSNSITADSGDVEVSGSYHGMDAASSGSNSIKTDSGNVSVLSDTAGMYAQSAGSNSIEAENGHVAVTATGSYGVGMSADSAGKNSIVTKDDNVAVTATGSSNGHGMYADGSGSSNSIKTTGGAVEVSGTSTRTGSTPGYGFGMRSDNSGSNSIITDSGDVKVSASVGYGNSYGMAAVSSGSNSIETSSGNVTISSYDTSSGTNYGTHYGTFTSDSSRNSITTQSGNVSISGSGTEGHGVHTQAAGEFSITTTSGDVKVSGTTTGAGSGYGVLAISSGSSNSIMTGSGNVNVTGSGKSGYGMHADSSGSNSIATGSGNVSVTGQAENYGYGMYAASSGSNSIEAENGHVAVTATGSFDGHGMYAAGSGSSNSIKTTGGAVEVSGTSTTSTALGFGIGMRSDNSGSNSIITDSGDVKVSASAGYGLSYGMFAKNSGSNTIETVDGNVTVAGESTNSYGYGMYATSSGSKNTITTNNGDVEVTGNSYGMYATSSGSNEIKTAGGNVEISTSRAGEGAMYANASGSNSVTTTSGDVKVTISREYGNDISTAGMNATAGSNSIKTETGNVSVTGIQHGVFAGSSGSNAISTTTGDVEVTGYTGYNSIAHKFDAGMCAISSGGNSIKTETGNVTVSGSRYNDSSYGMYAEDSGSSNSIRTESGNVTVSGSTGSSSATYSGHGMYAASSGSNSITTESGDVKVSGSSFKGDSVGMTAESSGSNSIRTDSGNVTVSGSSENVLVSSHGYGMSASDHGSNKIETVDGNVTVSGKSANGRGTDYGGHGMFAQSSGNNVIRTDSGNVTVSGQSSGGGASTSMYAEDSGSNVIRTDSGNVTVSGRNYGMTTESSGSNTIFTVSGDVTVSAPAGLLAGLVAASGGTNTISTSGGKVSVSANNTGLQASGAGSSNVITGKDIDITARTSSSNGLLAEKGGRNSVSGYGGNVALSGGNVLRATGAYSENSLSVDNGSIEFNSWSGKVNWSPSNSLLYYDDSAAYATDGGSNDITGSGGTGISFTGQGFGLRADSGGSNSVTTDGDVTFSGITQALAASGTASGNTLNADNIVIDSKVYADRSVAAVDAKAGGQNTLAASSGGAITITTSAATGNERDPYSASINDTASVRADGAGNNTLSADTISLDNQCGKGLAATNGGVNTLESAQGSPLTVTITASADAAEKAIAMWADGGGSINYITGHSQADGTGDSITLTANNGQGIAMQAENGGQNIITTGAGNDSVTINGNIVGDGNEINLGSGQNTLTLNGTVQPGSLNVLATGGTYTLILQAADTQGFIAQYGEWLDAVRASFLFSGGLEAIKFEGLSGSDLADFLDVFNDVLWDLKENLVDIQPPYLADQLHGPAAPTAAPLSAMLAETGAETDTEHHAQDAQHAAGHDDMQDSPLAAHDGPALMTDHMTGDDPAITFSAQPDNTAHAEVPGADALGADILDDATALTHFSEDADGQVQPLFAFLSDPAAGTSTDMAPDMLTDMPADLFEEGDDALHNGYLGNEGGGSGDFAELYTPVTLTYGDESLDSLFAATDVQDTEQDGTGLFGETDLHDMGLTDMNTALDQSHLAGPAAPDASGAPAEPAVTGAESAAAATSEISSIPSVADSCQEATDNAAREMTNC